MFLNISGPVHDFLGLTVIAFISSNHVGESVTKLFPKDRVSRPGSSHELKIKTS